MKIENIVLGVPTGSGKTLPQLATILTMPGTYLLNWPVLKLGILGLLTGYMKS